MVPCLILGLCSVKSKTKFQMVPCLIQGLCSVKSKTELQMVDCLILGLCSVKSKTKFHMVPCLIQGLCSVKCKTKFQMIDCLIQGLCSVKSKTKFQMVDCLIKGLCSVTSKTKFWMVPSQCLYQQQSPSLWWTKINARTYDAAAWTGGGPLMQTLENQAAHANFLPLAEPQISCKNWFTDDSLGAIHHDSLTMVTWGLWGRDSSVVRVLDSRLKGHRFESLQERRENFLLQGQLSVLTLISVSIPPPCYRSSM